MDASKNNSDRDLGLNCQPELSTPAEIMQHMLEQIAHTFAQEPQESENAEADRDAQARADVIVHQALAALGALKKLDDANNPASPVGVIEPTTS
jgi:hypothetical protein